MKSRSLHRRVYWYWEFNRHAFIVWILGALYDFLSSIEVVLTLYDVIIMTHIPSRWSFVRRIHRLPVVSLSSCGDGEIFLFIFVIVDKMVENSRVAGDFENETSLQIFVCRRPNVVRLSVSRVITTTVDVFWSKKLWMKIDSVAALPLLSGAIWSCSSLRTFSLRISRVVDSDIHLPAVSPYQGFQRVMSPIPLTAVGRFCGHGNTRQIS